MSQDKAKIPSYIVGNLKGTTLLTDRTFARFWKMPAVNSFSSLIHTNELDLSLQPPTANLFDHEDRASFGSQEAAIVGVPYGGGSIRSNSLVSGFPDFLRSASLRYPVYSRVDSPATSGLYDLAEQRYLFEGLVFRDLGNIPVESTDTLATLTKVVDQLMRWSVKRGVHLIAIGGDHSITFALVHGLAEVTGRPVLLVQFDAHHDCGSDPTSDERVHQGNFVRHLLGLDHVAGVVQLGVRGIRSPSQVFSHPKLIQQPFGSSCTRGLRTAVRRMLRQVPGAVGYLSIDLDALDPAEFPLVDFPMRGGLTSRGLAALIQEVFSSGLTVLGTDLVEGLSGGSIEQNAYDVPLYILAHCLDGISRKKTGFQFTPSLLKNFPSR